MLFKTYPLAKLKLEHQRTRAQIGWTFVNKTEKLTQVEKTMRGFISQMPWNLC